MRVQAYPQVTILYAAKKRTQWAALASATTASVGYNRGAYFFQVVRDLLEQSKKGQAELNVTSVAPIGVVTSNQGKSKKMSWADLAKK